MSTSPGSTRSYRGEAGGTALLNTGFRARTSLMSTVRSSLKSTGQGSEPSSSAVAVTGQATRRRVPAVSSSDDAKPSQSSSPGGTGHGALQPGGRAGGGWAGGPARRDRG